MKTIKKMIYEWLLTFSNHKSLVSSKKIERFAFVSVVILSVITCIVYEIVEKHLTAMEVTILTAPLLVAAGYGMSKTEEEKQNNKKEE